MALGITSLLATRMCRKCSMFHSILATHHPEQCLVQKVSERPRFCWATPQFLLSRWPCALRASSEALAVSSNWIPRRPSTACSRQWACARQTCHLSDIMKTVIVNRVRSAVGDRVQEAAVDHVAQLFFSWRHMVDFAFMSKITYQGVQDSVLQQVWLSTFTEP